MAVGGNLQQAYYQIKVETLQPLTICVLNPGSATVKWAWFKSINDGHADMTGQASIDELDVALQQQVSAQVADIYIVRFVHGGPVFSKPIIITDDIIPALYSLIELAPLHNEQSIKCVKNLLQHSVKAKIIAVFDTEFFHDLPKVSQLYGLPKNLQEKYRIRRYGFHGFAHAGMKNAWESLSHQPEQTNNCYRLITLQLGSGCSMAAILGGRPIETSMGFTPNEGLLMSSRSGDIDPGLLTWLQRREAWSPQETDRVLNEQSGWLGVSGESANMADLLDNHSKDAQFAIELFVHRIRKTLGAYYALLGGLDGIVLSGGIAEHSIPLCHRLLKQLGHLGIELAPVEALMSNLSSDSHLCFTTKKSSAFCWLVSCDEHQAMLESVIQSDLLHTTIQGKSHVSG
jgi:acetate kinase